MSFLYNGAKSGEPGIYVTLDERPNLVRQDMLNFGWDLQKLEEDKKIILFDATVTRLGIESGEKAKYSQDVFDYKKLISDIEDQAKKIKAKRIVIDSLAVLGSYFEKPEHIREAILEMIYSFSELGLTSLLISEISNNYELNSKYGVEEFVSDGAFILKFLDTGIPKIKRTLLIRKMRGTKHSTDIHPVEITDKGLLIKSIDDYKL
jgi:KaiC/GvpD/RAD55 family RecA-like ATPase